MAILANFIGINKHQDPNIRDLTGAQRDARALWALFSDTIPEIKSELLLDEAATIESVRGLVSDTFENATSNDTIIMSFAGHGTHDHRLVMYNTVNDNLDSSTITMGELAAYFRNTNAQKVLLILDCCFSGGVPARVLEDSPILREFENPLEKIAGEGRILLVASNIDQPAYELPGSKHGLLTKALIDVMQSGDKQIDILLAISSLLERVRSDAKRIGVQQTPVLFGTVKGGFILPKLEKGEHYYKEFPEAKGIKIGSDIFELKAFGIPNKILSTWDEQFKRGLNDLQLEAINEYRILDGESLLVVAPTSSGKTFIGEMATAQAVVQGRKTVFLFPYRALTNEKYEQFSLLYGNTLGMRVIRCTGDYIDQISHFVEGKYDLALLTYEMFLNLSVNNPWVLTYIGVVIIDEVQFIADPNRGITVELLITYLLTAREKGIAPQIVALSAVIGGTNNFDLWLGCQKLINDKRPVPLIEGVIDRSGLFQYKDISGQARIEQLLSISTIIQRKERPSAQDIIVPLVRKLIQDNPNEKIIVFRNQRGIAEGAANYLAQEMGLSPALETLELLPTYDLSTTSARLKTCLEGGTAFHNTNLTREEKAIVEQAFRDPDSRVRILGATTTVAAGINTPASTVIIAEQNFVGEDGREFTVAEYKNMAGRAGRVGFQEEGKAIIIADTHYQREQLFNKYVNGELEILISSFDPNNIETWIIRLLAQIERIPKKEVMRLLSNTYGGYLANRNNPKWHNEMDQQLEILLERMISLALVEQEGEYVQLTLLGRACGSSALRFESTMRLVEFLRNIESSDLSAERLMVLLQALPELDEVYTPIMRKGQKESVRQREAIECYNTDVVSILQRYAPREFGYYARCKRTAILWDWINGITVEKIENKYSTTQYQGRIGYGDIRKIADNTRFHLRSAFQIANVMLLGGGLNEESVEVLLKQLEVGIPKDTIDLLSLPIPLERGQYLSLIQAGIKTIEEYWTFSPGAIKKILGEDIGRKLEKFRPK